MISKKYIFPKIEYFLKKYYILIFISLVSLIVTILPFIISNNLEGFDTIGQYANAFYIKNFFWPWPSGWNSMLLSGFPQGIFYPPFFHWITSLLSFVFPLSISYKIVLSSAILFFPIIIFILASRLFKNHLQSTATVILVSILYYFNVGLNDNLFSDLYFGMSSHLFSLTILFIYLYFLNKLFESNKKWQLPALFLAILIITHIITAPVAILFGLIILIINWKNTTLRIGLIKHYILAILLSAWWIVPFVLNINYISGSNASSALSPALTLAIPFILILSLITYNIKSDQENFFKAISVFNALILIAYLFSNLFSINSFPIHFSRIIVYPFLFSPFLVIYFFSQKTINWQKINLILFFCFCFYIFYLRIIPIGPFETQILKNVETYWQGGRVMTSGDSVKLDDRFHSTKTKLAMNHLLPVPSGLFTESSNNGWFMMSLINSWDTGTNKPFVWAYNDLEEVIDLGWGSKIFGINYEYRIQDKNPTTEERDLIIKKENFLSEKELKEKIEKQKEINNLNFKINRKRLLDDEKVISILDGEYSPFYYQSFYKVNDTSIAEALSIRPINITNKWKDNVLEWWTTNWLKTENDLSYNKPTLLYKTETENWFLAKKDTNLVISTNNKKMDSFIVDASAFKTSVPIYVKISYFPFWKAYDESGQSLKIHKASPNFMLVYSNGVINFKYEEPLYYYLSYIISGISLLFISLNLILKRITKKN